jgi:hypothetical protein
LSRWSTRSGSHEQRTPWQTMHTLSVPWDHAWRSVIDDRWQNADVCIPLPGKALCERVGVQIPPSACAHTYTSVTSLRHKHHKIQPLESILPLLLDTNTTPSHTGSTLVCMKSVSYVCHTSQRTSRR